MQKVDKTRIRYTHDHHRKQNETSTRSLHSTLVTVDRVVGAQRSQDQAAGKVSDNLQYQSVSQSQSSSARGPEHTATP